MRHKTEEATERPVASMRPRLEAGECTGRHAGRGCGTVASMRPRLEAGECRERYIYRLARCRASMRPRLEAGECY